MRTSSLKKIKCAMLSVLLLAGLLLAPLGMAFPVLASDGGQIIENAANGVVRIFGVGSRSSWIGSGFLVGHADTASDIIVTNHHVIWDEDANEVAKEIYVVLDNSSVVIHYDREKNKTNYTIEPGEGVVRCQVEYTTETGFPDYAILRAERPISERSVLPLVETAESVSRGSTVWAIGYPSSADDIGRQPNGNKYETPITGTPDQSIISGGQLSKYTTFVEMENTKVIVHKAQINGGNSGGPLVRADGGVIGINTYKYGDLEYSLSVYIDYVVDKLQDLGIAVDVIPAKPQSDSVSGETETYTVIFCDETEQELSRSDITTTEGHATFTMPEAPEKKGYIFQGWSKTPEGKKLYRENETVDLYEPGEIRFYTIYEKAEPFPTWAIAVILAIAVVVVILIAFLIMRKPKPQDPQNNTVPPELLRLQSVSGVFGSRRFSIPNPMRVGTEPSSNDLVFPAGTPGVSRQHCQFFIQNGALWLQDLNSSYGTYYNGQKLQPQQTVRLQAGDTVSLGGQSQSFRIAVSSPATAGAGRKTGRNLRLIGQERR